MRHELQTRASVGSASLKLEDSVSVISQENTILLVLPFFIVTGICVKVKLNFYL